VRLLGTVRCLCMEKNTKKHVNKFRVAGLFCKEALAKMKGLAYAKFDETVDVDVNVGIDPSKGEQVVRVLLLPHGRANS